MQYMAIFFDNNQLFIMPAIAQHIDGIRDSNYLAVTKWSVSEGGSADVTIIL